MAANDYYSSYPNDSHRPHPPQHTPSAQSISPVTSPFQDANRYDTDPHHDYSSTAHLAHTQTGASSAYSDTAYHANANAPSNPYNNHYDAPPAAQHDPFADQNAIPLQNHGKTGTHATAAGVYQMDPEGRPREKRRKKKKKGWFSGRVTWVVYILTTVQIGVFIGELIKNGTPKNCVQRTHT